MKKTLPVLSILMCFLTVSTSRAETLVINAGYTLDPATAEVSENQVITIVDGIIEKIEPHTGRNLGPSVIDLRDSWVLPGFVDAHLHITWDVPEFGAPRFDQVNIKESNALRALRGMMVAQEFLHAGFTTIKDIGNDGDYATLAIIQAIDKGWFQGPDIQYAGKIIAPYGGQISGVSFRNRGYWNYEYIDADTRDEMVKAIRQNIYFGADAIKLVTDKFSYHYDEDDIRFMVEEAAHSGLKLTVHVMGGDAARATILGGAAGIEHGFDLDDELLKLMKKHGTYLIGTDFSVLNFQAYGDTEAEAESNNQKLANRLRRAHEIGVKIAFGSDIIINLPGKNRAESSLDVLQTWKRADIPPLSLLQAMTSNAADLMGLQDTIGRIKPGFKADLVALSENPLESIDNIHTVHFVLKSGVVIRND